MHLFVASSCKKGLFVGFRVILHVAAYLFCLLLQGLRDLGQGDQGLMILERLDLGKRNGNDNERRNGQRLRTMMQRNAVARKCEMDTDCYASALLEGPFLKRFLGFGFLAIVLASIQSQRVMLLLLLLLAGRWLKGFGLASLWRLLLQCRDLTFARKVLRRLLVVVLRGWSSGDGWGYWALFHLGIVFRLVVGMAAYRLLVNRDDDYIVIVVGGIA